MIVDMPAVEYHAIKAINSSSMGELLRSPAHYEAYDFGLPSAAMRLGTAIHAAVLEPDLWALHQFEIGEFKNPDTGRKNTLSPSSLPDTWAAAERTAPPGSIIVAQGQIEVVDEIALRVGEHPAAFEMVGSPDSVAEVTMLWDEGGVPCKARADLIVDGCIVDLKTTQDASLQEFRRSIQKYGYYRQAAWYLRGAFRTSGKRLGHRIIAVETKPPYAVAVYEIDEPALTAGMAECERAVKVYQKWIADGVATAYDPGIQSIGIPAYMLPDESVFDRTDIFKEGDLV
jgi:hypothetical protein